VTPKTLKAAIAEAERFLKIAKAVNVYETTYLNRKTLHVESGKNAAACKRASMDLTRALAEIRRS
jgi:hypothetical protein